jgi:hypothetical protein
MKYLNTIFLLISFLSFSQHELVNQYHYNSYDETISDYIIDCDFETTDVTDMFHKIEEYHGSTGIKSFNRKDPKDKVKKYLIMEYCVDGTFLLEITREKTIDSFYVESRNNFYKYKSVALK